MASPRSARLRHSETLPQKNLTDHNFSNLRSVLNVKLQPDAVPMKGQARWPIKREGCVLPVLRQQVPKQASTLSVLRISSTSWPLSSWISKSPAFLTITYLFPNLLPSDNSHSQRPTLRRQTRSFFLLLIHKIGMSMSV